MRWIAIKVPRVLLVYIRNVFFWSFVLFNQAYHLRESEEARRNLTKICSRNWELSNGKYFIYHKGMECHKQTLIILFDVVQYSIHSITSNCGNKAR